MNGRMEECGVLTVSARPRALLRLSMCTYALAIVMSCLVAAALCTNAYAQKSDPFATAGEHAGFAAKAKALAKIQLHLHHALNCLEGSTGQDYKDVPENPCTGKGALQTLPKESPKRVRAQNAIAIARVAVKLQNAKAAHYAAEAVHAILTGSQKR